MFSAIPVCRASGMFTDRCGHLCFCVPLLGSSQCVPLPPFLHRLMLLRISIHPKGLTPFQAAKVWHLRHVQKLPWAAVREQVRTSDGGHPRRYAVVDAVRRISEQRHTAAFRRTGTATTAYSRCGRKQLLSPQQKAAIVTFVKRWRSKRFCTAAYIVQELQLSCCKKTVVRALNAAGYHWCPVCRRGKLTDAQLAARRAFVDAHVNKPAPWWREHLGLVLRGVTLTNTPRPCKDVRRNAAATSPPR